MVKPKSLPKNIPEECGQYWARPKGFNWYPFIVEVYGKKPYLRISIIANNISTIKMAEDDLYNNLWFGPKIDAGQFKSAYGMDES